MSKDYAWVMAEVEALLFASSDGLTIEELSSLCVCDEDTINRVLKDLKSELVNSRHRGLELRMIKDRYLFSTKKELSETLVKLFNDRPIPKLTRAAYEVLAVVAYNQPCTRLQIEAVRGVNSDSVVSRLLELNLIEQSGILDLPGRPSLYSVSEYFLKSSGLSSVNELPTMELLQYDSLQSFEKSAREASLSSVFDEE